MEGCEPGSNGPRDAASPLSPAAKTGGTDLAPRLGAMTISASPDTISRLAPAPALAALLTCLPVVALASPETSGSGPESGQELAVLAGIWELDPEESDDPAEVMQRAAAREEEGRGGRRGRGAGSGPPGGMGRGGMGGRGAGGGPGGGGNSLLSLPDLLEIESGGGELRLVLDERVQILYLDGEEHVREDGRGGKITSAAEFRGGIARVREVRELPTGKLEVFRTLQATGDVLVVRTELKMPRRGDTVLLRSVYWRVP